MNRLLNALFNHQHLGLLILLVYIEAIAILLEVAGLIEVRYDFLVVSTVGLYLVFSLIYLIQGERH